MAAAETNKAETVALAASRAAAAEAAASEEISQAGAAWVTTNLVEAASEEISRVGAAWVTTNLAEAASEEINRVEAAWTTISLEEADLEVDSLAGEVISLVEAAASGVVSRAARAEEEAEGWSKKARTSSRTKPSNSSN